MTIAMTSAPPRETTPILLDDHQARVPNWIYTDPDVYRMEQAHVFAPNWHLVALAAEVPRGSYRRSYCGDLPVLVTQDNDGHIECLVNQCVHRSVQFVQPTTGACRGLTCDYHGWRYRPDGQLTGVPYEKGANGCPGLAEGFRKSEQSMRRLKVEVRNGAVFATAGAEEDLQTWLGPEMAHWLDRTIDGRPLQILGRSKQLVPANWKDYLINLKDSYHGGIYHWLFVSMGLARADQPGGVRMDATGRHSVLLHKRARGAVAATDQVATWRPDMRLQDPSFLQVRPWHDDGFTTAMASFAPLMVMGDQQGCTTLRRVVPRGPGEFVLHWTFFAPAGEPLELTALRKKQARMQGPAGLISAEDSDMLTQAYWGYLADPYGYQVLPMGGYGTGAVDTALTEAAIRDFLSYWQKAVGL